MVRATSAFGLTEFFSINLEYSSVSIFNVEWLRICFVVVFCDKKRWSVKDKILEQKRQFHFSIVNFPFLCNITAAPANGVYISQLIWHVYSAFSIFPDISWREQVNFLWDIDEIRFVLDQHAELDLYCASSLKQQSAGKHVAPLTHIILISSQTVFALSS